MPIYEFECKECGTVEEHIMGVNDAHPQNCQSCKAGSMVKLMSRTNFVLKGEGWYVTDFRKDNKGKKDTAPASDDAAPSGDTKGEAAPSESKTETSTETSADKSAPSAPKPETSSAKSTENT